MTIKEADDKKNCIWEVSENNLGKPYTRSESRKESQNKQTPAE